MLTVYPVCICGKPKELWRYATSNLQVKKPLFRRPQLLQYLRAPKTESDKNNSRLALCTIEKFPMIAYSLDTQARLGLG